MSPPLATFATRLPMSAISAALVQPATNQLPPISKFKGKDPDQEGGNFEEWFEQFKLIAEAYSWDLRATLVNVIQGQAYTFNRTCSPEQRADYVSFKSVRFRPVRLQAVHSN